MQRNGDSPSATQSPAPRLLFSITLNYTTTTLTLTAAFEFEKWEVEEAAAGTNFLWYFWLVMMLLSLQSPNCDYRASAISTPCGGKAWGPAWLSNSDHSLVASSFTELGSAADVSLAASAPAAFSSTPQGEAAQQESAGAMQKAKVHGGVSSTTAANKLQAAPSCHGHSLPIPITPKSQA